MNNDPEIDFEEFWALALKTHWGNEVTTEA